MAIEQVIEEGVNLDNVRTLAARHEPGENQGEITLDIRDQRGQGEKIRVSLPDLNNALQRLGVGEPITLEGRMRKEKLVDFSFQRDVVGVWIRSVDAGPADGYFLRVRIQDLHRELAPYGVLVEDPSAR